MSDDSWEIEKAQLEAMYLNKTPERKVYKSGGKKLNRFMMPNNLKNLG